MNNLQKIVAIVAVLQIVSIEATNLRAEIYHGDVIGKTYVRGNQIISENKGQYPFIAALANMKDEHLFCGAAIIENGILLTAAHCVMNKDPKQVVVRAGSFMRSGSDENLETRKVLGFIPHDNFKCDAPEPRDSDIAIVVLKKPFTFNQFIKAIPLVDAVNRNKFFLEKAVVLGWGYTDSRQLSPYLRRATPVLLSQVECEKRMYNGKTLTKNMICTLDEKKVLKKQGACKGDSGGPLVIPAGKGEYLLTGIVSAATLYSGTANKCDTQFPTVYADVATLTDWIQNKIKNEVPVLITKSQSFLHKCKLFVNFSLDDENVSTIIT